MTEINSEEMEKVLDAYFQFRSSLPLLNFESANYMKEEKTTQDIIDELSTMATLTFDYVNDYMHKHEYTMATTADGKLCWAIWRDINRGI